MWCLATIAEQIRYAIARRESKSITDACAAIGMSRAAFYKWPEEERVLIDEAVRLMARDGLVTAMHLRRRALAEAMAVKVAGLRSKDERVRQATATELIEWELGKATQRNEVTGKDGGPLEMVWDDGREVTPFASRPTDGLG